MPDEWDVSELKWFSKIICETVWLWSPMWPTSSKIEDLSASDSLWIFNVSRRLCSDKVGHWSRGYYNFLLSVRLESYYLFWFVKMKTVISFDVYSRSKRISRMSPIRTFSGFFLSGMNLMSILFLPIIMFCPECRDCRILQIIIFWLFLGSWMIF